MNCVPQDCQMAQYDVLHFFQSMVSTSTHPKRYSNNKLGHLPQIGVKLTQV